jgi:hypothetical protein
LPNFAAQYVNLEFKLFALSLLRDRLVCFMEAAASRPRSWIFQLYTAMHRDEKMHEAVAFVQNAVAYYAGLGVRIKRLLTNNGAAFRSKEFAAACKALSVQHKFTRPTARAERFIQSVLREWAYGWTYQNSAERPHALVSWQHYYNWLRPRSSIGHIAPMFGLKPAHNVLTVHI